MVTYSILFIPETSSHCFFIVSGHKLNSLQPRVKLLIAAGINQVIIKFQISSVVVF